MPADPPADLVLTPINGKGRPLHGWLTTFHLALVVIDPFTDEAAWILKPATRILQTFDQADARVAWLVTGTPEECRLFLGPWADEVLTFADPQREAVKALGLERLPAFVHIAMDGTVMASAEGWQPPEWEAVADNLATVTSWRAPLVPAPGDPGAFEGTPALA